MFTRQEQPNTEPKYSRVLLNLLEDPTFLNLFLKLSERERTALVTTEDKTTLIEKPALSIENFMADGRLYSRLDHILFFDKLLPNKTTPGSTIELPIIKPGATGS